MRQAAHERPSRNGRPSASFASICQRLTSLLLAAALLSPATALAGQPGGALADKHVGLPGAWWDANPALLLAGEVFNFAGRAARTLPLGLNPAPAPPPRRPPTKAEREARVARIDLNSAGGVNASVGQPVVLLAMPLDSDGKAVQGLAAEWESSDPRIVKTTKDGDAFAVAPGNALLVARAGRKAASLRVTVVEESAGGAFGGTKKTSVRGGVALPSRVNARPASGGGAAFVKASYREASPPAAAAATVPFVYASEDTLPDNETGTLYDSANDVGKPPGKTEPGANVEPAAFPGTETPASENFSMNLPLVSLYGRGPGVSLALSYNSRIWHQSFNGDMKTHLTYDVDSGWPAPGFRLGYGQIESQGSFGFTLTDRDGTRHEMVQRASGQPDYNTVDGTFITFRGGRAGGTVTHSDGTRVEYGAAGTGNRSFPVRITDRDGNKLTISYIGGVGPRIQSVKDAMARYVRFYYDGTDLSSISVPKYAGAKEEETTIVRFYYGTVNFAHTPHAASALFNTQNVTPHHPDEVRVLRYVHFTGTGSGFRYDYSGYAMIYQVVQLRAMQPVNFDFIPTQANVEGDGQWAATTTYDYPLAAVPLSGVPTYSTRTDDWAGRTSVHPVYTFHEGFNLSRVTAPDGTVTETTTIIGNGEDLWRNGLVGETVVKAENGMVRSRTKYDWERGATGSGGVQRVKRIWSTNEAGQTRAIVYNQYDSYNNVLSMSEHDFAAADTVGTELRRTETAYVGNANYINRRLLHLPESVRVVNAVSGKVASLTKYFYDETPLLPRGASPVEGHDQSYNPDAPGGQVCTPNPQCDPADVECGCRWEPQYDPATAFRGLLTTVKSYSNAESPSDDNATVNTVKYDILGNPVELTVNCCRKKTFNYTAAYHFAYPETETRGDGELGLTTHALYDFNTGLLTKATDENGQATNISYDVATQRPVTVERPEGGGRTDFHYQDSLLPGPGGLSRYSRQAAVTTFDTGRTTESRRYRDGRGALVRSLASYTAAQGWVTSDVEYDRMGRAFRMSNPYYGTGEANAINPSNLWTTNSEYDNFGRPTEVTLPDGTKSHVEYAGRVVTFTDQAGRARRSVSDALGRVTEIHEPGADGALGSVESPAQKTSYEYDALSNLTKVTQAGSFEGGAPVTQVREFRYDSLSRLTHVRHAEETARLNDDGAAGESGAWTSVLKYDTWGNLTDSFDARGVGTHVQYDTLNRMKSIVYSGETGTTTPGVAFTYDQARTDANGNPYFNRGALTSITTAQTADAPATAQEFDYDRLGRVAAQRQIVGANAYTLAYEYNMAGQLKKQTYPSGRVVAHAYDDAGRLSGAAAGERAYASAMVYAAHGGLTATALGNGTSQQLNYNSRLQTESLTLTRGTSMKVIQRYAYKYGSVNAATGEVDETKNAGQVGKVEGFIGGSLWSPVKQWEQRFSYDSVGRLTEAAEKHGQDMSQQSWRDLYNYDRWGNRYQQAAQQTQPLGYIPVEAGDIDRQTNRFTAQTQTAAGVEYDHAGRIKRDTKFRGRQYAYDANGRQVWSALLNGTGEARAAYDALGQRVRTTFAGQERVYVYDIMGRIVAEYGTASGEGGTKYIFTDNQGSTRVVLDGQGAVKSRRDYAPFGGEIGAGIGPRTGAGGQFYNAAEGTRQQYAMTEKDAETGLDHTLWRKYDNLAGRWTSPDPYGGSMNLGAPQSFNRYAYVGNDPVNLVDPSGLNAEAPKPCNNGTGTQQVDPATGKIECVSNHSEAVTVTGDYDASVSLSGESLFGRVNEIPIITPDSRGGTDLGGGDPQTITKPTPEMRRELEVCFAEATRLKKEERAKAGTRKVTDGVDILEHPVRTAIVAVASGVITVKLGIATFGVGLAAGAVISETVEAAAVMAENTIHNVRQEFKEDSPSNNYIRRMNGCFDTVGAKYGVRLGYDWNVLQKGRGLK